MVSNVEIISSEIIKPSSPTPIHLKTLNLSFLDQIAPPIYVPLIFFYRFTSSHDQISPLLKQSLSEILTVFYPLAGRIHGNSSIDCDDSGAEFVEARVQTRISEVIHEAKMEELKKLQPVEFFGEENNVVLRVKVCFFECGGVSIAVSLSHKIADGTSLVAFVNAWAATCGGRSTGMFSPNFDIASSFPPKTISGLDCTQRVGITKEKIVTKRFVFNKEDLARIKEKTGGGSVENPSRVEAVSAYIWRSFIKAAEAKTTSFAAVHAVEAKTTSFAAVHAAEAKTPSFAAAAEAKTTSSVAVHVVAEAKTTSSAAVHAVAEAKTTSLAAVHAVAEAKTTSLAAVHAAAEAKTTSSAAIHAVDEAKTTSFAAVHAVNLRPRASPPLSEHMFGNYWRPAIAVSGAGDECPELVAKLRAAIRRIDGEFVRKVENGEYLNELRGSVEVFGKGGNEIELCNFSSWCRFPTYEADFGWGKPDWVCTTTLPFKNLVILMSTPCGEGIEAWVNMVEEDMEVFQHQHLIA